MKLLRRIRLPEMKFSAAHLFLFLALAVLALTLSSCATDDPENMSVRPWNAPQGWENGMGGMQDYQHR
jgi:hypothetical protein